MTWSGPREQAEALVRLFLDDRLTDAGEPPGVREAVIQEVVAQVEPMEQRFRRQVDQLRSPSSKRIPNAYFADEEALENALQYAAAGVRAARAREGFVNADARGFEAPFAFRLAASARWALLQESSRVPRPATRHHLLAGSLGPIPWQDNENGWPPPTAVELRGARTLKGSDAEPVRVVGGPYNSWVQLAMFERQATLASDFPKLPSRQLLISTGLEPADAPVPAGSMPLGTNSPNIWLASYDRLLPGVDQMSAAEVLREVRGPLVGIADYDGQRGGPHRLRGVGLLPFSLVPRVELAACLDLRLESPAVRHCLVDGQGPALVGRNWRGFLIHGGGYTPLEPAVEGTDLLVRPDLYERVEATLGKNRIQLGIAVRHLEGQGNDIEDD